MKDFGKRVLEERSSVEVNIAKLKEFMHGDIFPRLAAVDQGLLMVQLEAMKAYSNVLKRRLERIGL